MSIQGFMNRIAGKDVAVYWSFRKINKDGTAAYERAREISCRWHEKQQNIIDINGKEVVSTATIYVVEDLDPQGMIYHGRLEDLNSTEQNDPREVKDAYEFKSVMKKPDIQEVGYNRKILV
jgi:hypothetical protein